MAKNPKKQNTPGRTIFVDEASRMVFCHLQVSLNVAKIPMGKHLIEREAQNGGVDVHSY